MAKTLYLRKLYDTFAPCDEVTAEAMEKMKANSEYKAVFTQPRNLQFHKKGMALVKVAFDAWEPEARYYKGHLVTKNIDKFREDITILAGYYDAAYRYDGEIRLTAKSWSFSSMDQDQFDDMYSKLIDVILTKILTGYKRSDLDAQVEKILRFC
jgi:hypothetical protein